MRFQRLRDTTPCECAAWICLRQGDFRPGGLIQFEALCDPTECISPARASAIHHTLSEWTEFTSIDQTAFYSRIVNWHRDPDRSVCRSPGTLGWDVMVSSLIHSVGACGYRQEMRKFNLETLYIETSYYETKTLIVAIKLLNFPNKDRHLTEVLNSLSSSSSSSSSSWISVHLQTTIEQQTLHSSITVIKTRWIKMF